MSKLGYNVGSGQRPFTSTPEVTWINVDVIARPNMPIPDLLCDGAHLPCEDGRADYFVLSHVLEHFQCNEATDLIKEAYRVLKPGGSLLVFVPDLRMLADRWLRGMMDTQLYMTNVYGAYMGDVADTHKWGFDRNSLLQFLVESPRPPNPTYQVGETWSWAGMFDWREIPSMTSPRDWWICGIECVR